MLGVDTSVFAVVRKRVQQLPTMLRPAVHRGKAVQPIRLCKPRVMRVRGPSTMTPRLLFTHRNPSLTNDLCQAAAILSQEI